MAVDAAAMLVDMDIHNEFIAQRKDLVFYAGKPVINKRHAVYDQNWDPWDFSAATNLFMQIFQEREGGLLMIDWDDDNLAISGSHPHEIILNASETDTAIERGKYYYQLGYLIAGGYEVLVGYGEAKFI